MGAGFGAADYIEAFCEWYICMGFNSTTPIRNYIGWLKEKPVATSTLVLGAGVAGIYCVSTIPEARRQGIGAAMTIRPLLDARGMGYRVGTLQASEMGFPVYRQIGFQEYYRVPLYIWQPNTDRTEVNHESTT